MLAVRVFSALCLIMVGMTAFLAFGARLGDRFGFERLYSSIELAVSFLGGAFTVMLYHYRLEAKAEVKRKEGR